MTQPVRPSASPLETFLALPAGVSDPVRILGLPAHPTAAQQVIEALKRRLASVSQHPLGSSPAASEVRMLLHSAAARLLLPRSSAGVSTAPVPVVQAGFETTVLLTLGASGGWNRRSSRKLMRLARQRGMSPQGLVATLRSLTQRPAGAAPRPAVGGSHVSTRAFTASRPDAAAAVYSPASEVAARQPVVNLLKAAIGGAIALAVLVIVALGMRLMLTPSAPGPRAAPSSATPSVPTEPSAGDTQPARPTSELFPVGPEGDSADTQESAAPEDRSVTQLLADLRACAAALEADPDAAVERFIETSDQLANKWTLGSPEQALAGVDASLEFLYRSQAWPEASLRAVRAVLGPLTQSEGVRSDWTPQRLSATVWAGGMAARMSGEHELSSQARAAIRRALLSATGGAPGSVEPQFRSGALAVLARLPAQLCIEATGAQPLPSGEDLWGRWVAATDIVTGGTSQRSLLMLSALEQVLTASKEPSQSPVVLGGIEALVRALPWDEQSPARPALARWMQRPDIPVSHLSALTAAVVGSGRARELDASMVLSASATEADRAELQERLATLWRLDLGAGRGQLVDHWRERARAIVDEAPSGTGPNDSLARATMLAGLNAAIWRVWRGDTEGVSAQLENLGPPRPIAAAGPTQFPQLSPDSPSPWALRYRSSGYDIPQRREMLAQFSAAPNALEASILVGEAVIGSPVQVREDARSVVERFAHEITVVSAMLESAPWMPATRENAALAEIVAQSNLPGARSPSWRVALRRALVARMIEMLSAGGALSLDQAVAQIADRYEDRLPAPPKPPAAAITSTAPIPAAGRAPSPEEPAARLRQTLIEEARRALLIGAGVPGVADVQRKYARAIAGAQGPVQRFVSEQSAVVELLAIVSVADRPGARDDVARVLDSRAGRLRDADHVFEQIEANESAMTRLWLIRLGEEP